MIQPNSIKVGQFAVFYESWEVSILLVSPAHDDERSDRNPRFQRVGIPFLLINSETGDGQIDIFR